MASSRMSKTSSFNDTNNAAKFSACAKCGSNLSSSDDNTQKRISESTHNTFFYYYRCFTTKPTCCLTCSLSKDQLFNKHLLESVMPTTRSFVRTSATVLAAVTLALPRGLAKSCQSQWLTWHCTTCKPIVSLLLLLLLLLPVEVVSGDRSTS